VRPHDRKPCTVAGIVYLKLKGSQGDIEGKSTTAGFGRENSIECTAFRFNIAKPHDRFTGFSTGRRYYEPITFVKDIDKATPRITHALITNEEIEEAEFRFFDSVAGTETLVYTIKTLKGTITSQRQFVSDTNDPALALRPPEEEVGLTFQSITGTWADGNIAFNDTWGQQ
jgi:type VI secretion system secreted protein Hcp